MGPGTIIRLPDGREGTVVFHGLCGYGIKWGRHYPDPSEFDGTNGDLIKLGIHGREPEQWEWEPDAYLRDPWPTADLECVGGCWEVVEETPHDR
jgi:hypothetical protein